MEWNYRRDFRRWKNIQENRSKEQVILGYMFCVTGEGDGSHDGDKNTGGNDMAER